MLISRALRSLFILIGAGALHLSALAQFPAATSAVGAVVETAQVRAELLALAPQGVAPGAPLWLGLQLRHQPGWHTYWKNPGDSGLSTQLQWDLPKGLVAGDIAWPTPQKIRIGSLANFGYEGQVLLPVQVSVTPAFTPGVVASDLVVKLSATWLVCREECIPQEGQFELRLPVQGSTALHRTDFEQAQNAAPRALSELSPGAKAQILVNAQGLEIQVSGLPAAWHGRALNAFAETANLIDTPRAPDSQSPLLQGNASAPGGQRWDADGTWHAWQPLSPVRTEAPSQLAWVVGVSDSGGNSVKAPASSVRFEAAVTGTWPPAGAANALSNPLSNASLALSTSPSSDAGHSSLLFILMSAMLGGLILNLMPCVFPVLAIKVLAFSGARNETGASHRAEGMAYSVGVIVSFLALGGLLLALRAAGEQLGWGFQLQSPWVISALAVLFTLIGMNLMGWLETGSVLPASWASLRLRHPLADAFLSGVLAVAIASPCTAPFMGASLGYAVTLPAVQALAIFAALGVGLALPYALASSFPAVARWMPRPGAWMDTVRRFLAFPMWATVVWVLWGLGHQSGVDGAFSLLALLLCVALLLWSRTLDGRSRTILSLLSLLILLGLGAALGPAVLRLEANASGTPARWSAWSAQKVEAELSAGHPVFVDFTAAWCITCQYNKRTTLADPDVLADFQARNVTLLEADWTRRDPAITQALQSLGRSGVPVYVLYRPGQPPHVLSEILSTSALRSLLQVN